MKQLSIGFDVDNTIAKMSKAFLLFHNEAYGTDIKFEDLKSHSLSKDIDINTLIQTTGKLKATLEDQEKSIK